MVNRSQRVEGRRRQCRDGSCNSADQDNAFLIGDLGSSGDCLLCGCRQEHAKSSGRASALDMRPSARAAAIATDSCRSSSRSISKATISGVARAQRQASARMAGSSCRSSADWIAGGTVQLNWTAAATATLSPGPEITLRVRSRATAWAASSPPIAASARTAAICSGTGRSAPNAMKRLTGPQGPELRPRASVFQLPRQTQAHQ